MSQSVVNPHQRPRPQQMTLFNAVKPATRTHKNAIHCISFTVELLHQNAYRPQLTKLTDAPPSRRRTQVRGNPITTTKKSIAITMRLRRKSVTEIKIFSGTC